VLFVTLKDDVSPSSALKKEISGYLRKQIGAIATPDEIYFVHSLPKTRSGKIMRRVIKAFALGKSPGDLTTLEDVSSVEELKSSFEALQEITRT
jgi:acetyl-CoA synthetase